MHPPVNFHALFLQLQTRYPTSSLTTELVQIHDGWFIVRAIVQVNTTPIATGLAAASVLEQAEDQARLRVLNVLGIAPATAESSQPVSTPAYEPAPLETLTELAPAPSYQNGRPQAQPHIVEPALAESPFPATLPSLDLPASFTALPNVPPSSKALAPEFPEVTPETPLLDFEPDPEALTPRPFTGITDTEWLPPEDFSMETSDIGSIAAPPAKASTSKPQKVTKPTKAIATSVEDDRSQPSGDLDDLSSIIALTDVEMDRIGWTKQQGREYLKTTYGKATRQKLDVEELMDFLHYLRALPSLHGL